jgi:adenosylcobinamide-GDP ribazoletransferase
MRRLLAAMRFLTILPLPSSWGNAEADLAGSAVFFPLVGLLLGAVAALLAWAASAAAAPPMVVSAAVIIALLGFSGGLHLDGLCDAADGLLSCRPKQQVLEIMKDSHVGAMGLMAVVCLLLMKFASLASLPQEDLWRTAWLMPLAGRCAIVLHMALLVYVRPSGLGIVFSGKRPYLAAAGALVALTLAGWLLLGVAGLVAAGLCLAVALGLAAYCHRRIGGATGDTYGAACEISEMVLALSVALCPPLLGTTRA